MKRTLCLFLALILAVGICFSATVTITASAAEAVTSGTCGASTNEGGESSVTWAYDSATTTLTISGLGAMADFEVTNPEITTIPWHKYKREITTVVIGSGVTTIGDNAFFGCTSLESIEIPNSVTTIGKTAFWCCRSLTTVTIGDSVTTIGSSAFYDCTKLASIKVVGANTKYSSEDGVLFNANKTELICYPAGRNAKSYTILDSVITIGEGAFKGCTELTSVTIPDSVTTIGESAFFDCKAIESIEIPNSVTTIGKSAFNDCTKLASVTIGESVTSIGDSAFYNCAKLTTIKIPDSVTTIGSSAFKICVELASVTIGESVTSIGDYAFKDCVKLASVTIGESVTSIGDYAFYNCTKLTTIKIPDSVTTIGSSAFKSCDELASVTIGESVTSIGDSAFYNCTKLTTIKIPDSVTTIGSSAFCCCTALASVTIGDSATSIGDFAFEDCVKLASVTIGESVTSIGDYAFSGCVELKTVNVPCDWNTENPPYAFDKNVNVAVARHRETIYVDNNDGTHTEKYSCCGTVIGEPEKHSFNESGYCEICEYQCTHKNTEPVYNSYEDKTNQHYKHYECCGVDELAGYHNDENGDTKCDQCKVQLVVKVYLVPATTMGIRNGDNYFASLENAIETANEILDGGDLILLSDAVINSEKALTIDKNKLDTNGKKLTVNGTLVLPDSEYTGATIPTGVVGSGTVKIGENFFKLADNGKWCCAEESQHTSSVQTCAGYLCELCGNYYGEANDNHDIVIDKAVEATCTKTGLTEGSHCTRCNDKTVKQNVIPTKAHTEVTVTGKAATCTATGLTDGKKCSVCNAVIKAQQVVAAKGHTPIKVGTQNVHTKCDVCEEILSAEHEFAIKITTEPTYTKEGIKTFTCECGYSYEEVIPCLVPGEIKAEEAESNSFSATVVDINSIVTKLQLTEEEKALIEQGADMKIVFKLSDIGSAVNTAEKEAIFKALTNEKIAVFLDIQLVKQIVNNSVNVHKLNDLIKVTVELPSEFISKDGNTKRSYSVLRYHDSDETKVTTLNAKFDEATGTLTFETDRFSTYAIVYSDVVVSDGEGVPGTPAPDNGVVGTPEAPKDDEVVVENDKNNTLTDNTTSEDGTSKDDVPKAGVISTTSIWLGAMALSGLGALLVSKKKKEND